MSPRRQHNCISWEIQKCLKPTSSLCQPDWCSLPLTQDSSLHSRKEWQTPTDFQGARLEIQPKALQFITTHSGCYFAAYEEIILTDSLILEWITTKCNLYWFTDHLTYWRNITRSYRSGQGYEHLTQTKQQVSEFFKYTNCRKRLPNTGTHIQQSWLCFEVTYYFDIRHCNS